MKTSAELSMLCCTGCEFSASHERQVSDIVSKEWTRKTAREARKKAKLVGHRKSAVTAAVARRAKQVAVGAGILGFIALELLSFLIQKVLGWLWNWWNSEPEAESIVCGMKG